MEEMTRKTDGWMERQTVGQMWNAIYRRGTVIFIILKQFTFF